jgi:hypothetical protein
MNKKIDVSGGEGFVVLDNNNPYGRFLEKLVSPQERWTRFETGAAIGVLPIMMIDEHLHVLLVKEDKPILGRQVLKVASDYLRGRPNSVPTARRIVEDKAHIHIPGRMIRVFKQMPGYYPNVVLLISLYLAEGWSYRQRLVPGITRCPIALKEAVNLVLSGEIRDVFSAYVLLLLEAMEKRGQFPLSPTVLDTLLEKGP